MMSRWPQSGNSVWGSALRVVGAFAAVFAALALLVMGLGQLTWALCGVKMPRGLQAAPAPTAAPAARWHRVAEWGAHARDFHEAPMLAERMQQGALPTVGSRLPVDPLVIAPPDQCGPYGGTWARYATDPNDIGTQIGQRLTYEGLLRWSPMADEVVPNLASRWQIADGGRTYTVWLRRGVRWSDGKPFSADDILFWYRDVLLNEELSPVVSTDLKPGGEVVKVEKLDDYTVRFRFKVPNGLFLKALASGIGLEMVDYPAHYLKQFHASYVDKAVLERQAKEKGFTFWYQLFQSQRDWRNPELPRLWAWVLKTPPPALTIVFERNPYYWKVDPQGNQLPYIDRLTFEMFDPETINMRVVAGQAGMQDRHLVFTNYPLLMEKQHKGRYHVNRWIDACGGPNGIGFNLNHRDEVMRRIFADKRFRIAMSYAINRAEINDACYFGIGKPRQMAPPPTSPYYDAAYEKAYVEYRPDLADKLLDEMGLAKRDANDIRLRPDGRPLAVSMETIAGMNTSVQALELVAEYWRAVGIKCEIKSEARQLFYQRKAAMMHDVAVWTGADEQVPIMDPRWFIPFSDESLWSVGYARWFRSDGKAGDAPPPEIRRCIDLYRQLQRTADEAEQMRLFRQIMDANRENLWAISLVGEVPLLCVTSDSFRNVPQTAVAGWVFRSPANTAPECYAIEPAK